jgi:hypothetical protein
VCQHGHTGLTGWRLLVNVGVVESMIAFAMSATSRAGCPAAADRRIVAG